MSAISRKVEWVKLRELRADEQELVRKRYSLRGSRMNTQKVQVIYTDGRIDSHHAPDCEWPSEGNERPFHAHHVTATMREWAGRPLNEALPFDVRDPHLIYLPAPCTCGVVQTEEYGVPDYPPRELASTTRFVRPHLGLCATRGTPKHKRSKGEVPTLIRFVPRPLTLAQAIEFEEVEDLHLALVLVDKMLDVGHWQAPELARKLRALSELRAP